MFLVLNPPEHARLRGLVMKSFSSKEIHALREIAFTVAHNWSMPLPGVTAAI